MEVPRWAVLVLFCQFVQTFMSYDGGATPASIDSIALTSGAVWTEVELGLLGSLDKLGMTISSVLWGRVLQLLPAKALLLFGLGLNSVSTFVFGNIRIKGVMFVAKFLMGVTQGLQCVWSTCWVLTHAPVEWRTVWMSLGAISAGIGNGIGTAVAGFGTGSGLPYSFAWQVESSVLGALWLLLVLCPGGSLSIDAVVEDAIADLGHTDSCEPIPKGQDLRGPAAGGDSPSHPARLTPTSRAPRRLRSRGNSAFDDDLAELIFPLSPKMVSKDSHSGPLEARRELVVHTMRSQHEIKLRRARFASHLGAEVTVHVKGDDDVLAQLAGLNKNRLYLRTALNLAAVMFVTSGVQFLWVRIFMAAWGIGKEFAVTGFLISTGLGGAVGVIFGPQAIDRCGGFMTAAGRTSSLKFIVLAMILACCGAALSVLDIVFEFQNGMGDTPSAGSLYVMWGAIFVVFAGFNASIAGLTGINVASVDPHMRSIASGCTVSIQNLLGYALGPLLPGLVMDAISTAAPGISEAKLLCFGLASVLCGAAAALLCSLLALRASRRLSEGEGNGFATPLLS